MKYTQDDRSVNYPVRDGDSAITSSHVKKLDVTEMKMCRWACGHTLRDHVRNDDIRNKTESREHNRVVQESKTEVVWPPKETRPRIRRKKDAGGGTTWEKK